MCEGSKTEYYYFRDLIDDLRLNGNFEISDEKSGCDPKNLVKFAKDMAKSKADYDRIYCVFDRDAHTTYHEATNNAYEVSAKGGTVIQPIRSVPCFEYWLLLHFEQTTRPFVATGRKSVCEALISELKNYMPNYQKGRGGVYQATMSALNTAIGHARWAHKRATETGSYDPITEVYILVQELLSLKAR